MATNVHTTKISSTQSSGDGIGLDRFYIRSLNGILKIAEVILDIIAFSCACVWADTSYKETYRSPAAGWIQFVTMSAIILTLILYFFHLFRIIYKLPGPWGLIELIYYCIYSLMLLIAGIVAAVNAKNYGSFVPSITATAIFTFAAFVVYCVDTLRSFIEWCRSGRDTGETVTTSTTQTTHETRTQY